MIGNVDILNNVPEDINLRSLIADVDAFVLSAIRAFGRVKLVSQACGSNGFSLAHYWFKSSPIRRVPIRSGSLLVGFSVYCNVSSILGTAILLA